jgi:hypothetical protein
LKIRSRLSDVLHICRFKILFAPLGGWREPEASDWKVHSARAFAKLYTATSKFRNLFIGETVILICEHFVQQLEWKYFGKRTAAASWKRRLELLPRGTDRAAPAAAHQSTQIGLGSRSSRACQTILTNYGSFWKAENEIYLMAILVLGFRI